MPEFIVRKDVSVHEAADAKAAAVAFFDSLGIAPGIDGMTVKVYEIGQPNPTLVTVWSEDVQTARFI